MGVSESTMILRLMRCTVCDVEVRNVNGSLLLNIHFMQHINTVDL